MADCHIEIENNTSEPIGAEVTLTTEWAGNEWGPNKLALTGFVTEVEDHTEAPPGLDLGTITLTIALTGPMTREVPKPPGAGLGDNGVWYG